ncbi:T9SS type A sorting domain-containing protein [candidate division KSB1 bacterium]|nr:T9SS type A sorting domain-containing protein [candidate division KSB1 bacterium]
MRRIKYIYCLIAVLFVLPVVSYAETPLYQSRIYEPVVILGSRLPDALSIPLDELFMYRYNAQSQSWSMMPFQVDERVYAEDQFIPGDPTAKQDFYFIPDDGLLDDNDELVFLIRDTGDKARASDWIDNEESKNYPRIEITLRDPLYPDMLSYAYLYRSSTIDEPIPSPYHFDFDPTNHVIETDNFRVRFNESSGLIEDISVLPPFGTGVDFFDTQKLRFVAVLDFGIINIAIGKNGTPAANERDNLYMYDDYVEYTQHPVVRLIRQVREAVRFGDFVLDAGAFYVRTIFYPFSGTVSGGATLDPDQLKEEFHTSEDIYVDMDLLRQSWDFNNDAIGMRFHNQYNQDILIDGQPDEVNTRMDVPIQSWMLSTGDPGSFFSYVEFQDTAWQDIRLYYHDDLRGGQDDPTQIDGGDTGDTLSYGDQGIVFYTSNQNKIDLRLGVTAYFLPANLSHSDGVQLAGWVEHPAHVSSQQNEYTTDVVRGRLSANPETIHMLHAYPNPFNPETHITLDVAKESSVSLDIYNIRGRHICRLLDRQISDSPVTVQWNGTDSQHHSVSAGIYILVAHTNDERLVRKVTLLP